MMSYICFENLFKFLSSLLTFGLMSQVLFTYVVEKPTSTSKEEKELENADLPEVVVCLDPPGLNSVSLERNGYHISTYWRGVLHPGHRFVGWNGGEGESKSSHDILEEALLIPNSSKKLISYSGYSENYADFKESRVTLLKLAFPSGRCLIIHPPSQNWTGTSPNLLHIDFSEAAFKKLNISLSKLRVFFMDKASSPRLYLDAMEMMGDQIEMGPEEVEHRSYRTRISRSQHVQGDPLLDCSVYTLENSYHGCIKREIHELFTQELGCQPPLFTEDLRSMCNEKFKNVSADKSRKIKALFLRLHYDDWSRRSKCRIPCTKNKYTTRFLIRSSYSHPQLSIIFDNTVDVTHSTFSVDKQTLLTKIGGSVSMGRTLLWILLTLLLGATQVKSD